MDKCEQIIEALEMSYRFSNVDENNTLVPQEIVLDIIALLKAQEPEAIDAPKPDSDIGCWYDITHNYTLEQVVSALKEQKPRVMTLEEVKQHNNQDGCVWFEQPTYNAVAAFVRKEDFEIEVISPYILGEPINHGYWLSSNYNVTWRCWTSKPSLKQMEETPWQAT